MKKIYLPLLLLAHISSSVSAQVAYEMGLNMANESIKSNNTKVKTSFKPGINLGFAADIALGEHAYFEPGIFYQMTGCKFPGPPKGKYNINTISFPLNFEYKSGEKCGNRFFFGAGPYIGYNISGTIAIDETSNTPSVSEDFNIGTGKTATLKALDAGFGLNVGYQLKMRLYARLRYQIGLTELNPNSDGDNTMKSSAFGFSLGYLFGHCNSFGAIRGFKSQSGSHWRGMSKAKYSRKVRHPRY